MLEKLPGYMPGFSFAIKQGLSALFIYIFLFVSDYCVSVYV